VFENVPINKRNVIKRIQLLKEKMCIQNRAVVWTPTQSVNCQYALQGTRTRDQIITPAPSNGKNVYCTHEYVEFLYPGKQPNKLQNIRSLTIVHVNIQNEFAMTRLELTPVEVNFSRNEFAISRFELGSPEDA
jgi:hypothetical protein